MPTRLAATKPHQLICFFIVLSLVSTLVVALRAFACSGSDLPVTSSDDHFPYKYGDHPSVDQLVTLGRTLFFDKTLSASGNLACATCHDPRFAYGPPNNLPIQLGGTDMRHMGFRNTPSLRYLHSPIAFTEHFLELEVTGVQEDEGPTGGRTWDGRVNSAHEQALMPLLDANEMANVSNAEIADRVAHAGYADEFKRAFSAPDQNVFDNPDDVAGWLGVAIEMFEQSPADFHPFTSKYDAYLRDEVQLTAQEQHGLALFNDARKGNCAVCHPSTTKNPKERPLFTDFGYVATGAPRNDEIPANRDPAFYDLGLCGPLRHDLSGETTYCGAFRTPSLRNVALRQSYFHNGVFHSLRDAVAFYATRETDPARWYPKDQNGRPIKYNDLPPQYRVNVNNDPPFKPGPGNRPRLNERDIDDVVAFLNTLTDGYHN